MRLIIYYSLTGCSRFIANTLAAEEACDVLELKDAKRRRMFNAYFLGSRQAMLQLDVPLAPIDVDLTKYDEFTLIFPIWAGFPAPPFNNAIELLPEGATVDLIMVSSSGDSSKGRPFVEGRLADKGITIASYRNTKA